jgi:hypothetical protein
MKRFEEVFAFYVRLNLAPLSFENARVLSPRLIERRVTRESAAFIALFVLAAAVIARITLLVRIRVVRIRDAARKSSRKVRENPLCSACGTLL